MESGYAEVLVRLKEERMKRNMNQTEISQKISMSQSHYSKAELGKKRFSYEQMRKLGGTGIDLHYVITSNISSLLEHQTFWRNIRPDEYYFFGQLFYVLAQRVCELQEGDRYEQLRGEIGLMRYVLNNAPENVWRSVRDYYGYTQAELAHVLGFDLKKYGNLENEKTYPDSEDLYLLYKHFSIPPQLVLGDYWGIVRAICDVMNDLEKKTVRKGMKRLFACWKP